MAITLIESKGLPPGGIEFKDPRVPSKKWDDVKTSLTERVNQVIDFRRQNPRIYDPSRDKDFLDFDGVRREVTIYNYNRLGRTSPYFHITDSPEPPVKNGCCGAPLEERLCPTCSNRKLIGYRCPLCGRVFEL